MMTGATSSESSDAEPHRRPARALRQRRLAGMRRRHLNASNLDSTSCRPQTETDRDVTNCSQAQETADRLPQVQLLEIRTTCDSSTSSSSSNTLHQGIPSLAGRFSRRQDNTISNSSRTCSFGSTEMLASTSSKTSEKPLFASNCGSERTNVATTLSATTANQSMSVPRTSYNGSNEFLATSRPMSSQRRLPAGQLELPQDSVTSRQGDESHTDVTAASSHQDTESAHSETSATSNTSQQQVLKETFTVIRVPMMRPNVCLLQVIRAAGGIGDVFSMRQIIHHVKNYIGERLMYDMRNPSITYCDGDLLGQALGVKQFSIFEAIGLFQRSCTPVQEYCIRTVRQVEAQPDTESSGQNTTIPEGNDQSAAVRSTTATAQDEEPIVVSDSHAYRETVENSSPCSSQGPPSSHSLASSNNRVGRLEGTLSSQEIPSSTTYDSTSTVTTSLSASQESSSCLSNTEVSSSSRSQDIGPSVSQTGSQDLSQPSPPSQPSSSFSSSASTTSAVINFKAAQSSVTLSEIDVNNTQSDQSSSDTSCDRSKPRLPKQETGIFIKEGKTSTNRSRSTSINLYLDEPDGDTGAWECRVRVQTGHTPSSDVNNTAQNDEDGTVVVEYESDHFSVEYEVASSSDEGDVRQPSGSTRSRNVSETSSISSGLGTGTAMLVVCKESDVEYLADYSDTDTGSDAELSEGDKWVCSYCSIKNPPFQRNCGGCWSIRFDWLPSSAKAQAADACQNGDGCDEKSVSSDKEAEVSGKEQSNFINENQSLNVESSLHMNSAKIVNVASGSINSVNSIAGLCEAEGPQAVISSSSEEPKTSQDFKRSKEERTPHIKVQNKSGDKTQAELMKAAVSASKLRAKKRQYSSGLSTSESQDECPKNKSQAPEVSGAKGSNEAKPKNAKTFSKSSNAQDESVNRPRKHRPSLYSEKTIEALSRNEVCVVCLTRPKTASIIHGKTGHQVCCYHCAKKLKKQRRACPICRKPIQKVIRNYHV